MYLAPLNYDRYFKKVFADPDIAKKFLEDFLDVKITSLEKLQQQQRITDDAAIVEFDFRCKIDNNYIIIDMQQWYKPDIVQRFYLYHALSTGLQLETLPKERFLIDHKTMKVKKVRDYRRLEPVLTIIWLADDTLHFKENYMAYTMTPELVLEFINNEKLWYKPEIRDLLTERNKVLAISSNKSKNLGFLSQNRLIVAFQINIVKQLQGKAYERWFTLAEKSKNKENVEADFTEYEGDETFEKVMQWLNKGKLSAEDITYIEHEREMWEEVKRLEDGYYQDGLQQGLEIGHEKGHKKGEIKGHKEGHKKGREEGHKEGEIKGKITSLNQIITLRFNLELGQLESRLIPLSLQSLTELTKTALTVETLADFEESLSDYIISSTENR